MVPSRCCLLFPPAQIAQHISICTINPHWNLNSGQNTTNIHLQASFLTDGIHICMQPEKKYVFCMQNRQVTPSLHREETTIFFCEGGRESFWKICWVAAKHLLFPRWGRNSDIQPEPKDRREWAHEGQSLSLCQDLDWVVNFIYVKYITVVYYMQWIHLDSFLLLYTVGNC